MQFLLQMSMEEDGSEKINYDIYTTHRLMNSLTMPIRLAKTLQNPKGRLNLYVEGVVHRFDFQNDHFLEASADEEGRVTNPPKWHINSITPAPSAAMLFVDLNQEWCIAAKFVDSFHHFLKKNWANWPN